MLYYSTQGKTSPASLKEAVMRGLPADNGLFMPQRIGKLPLSFWQNLEKKSFSDICFEVANCLIGEDLPAGILQNLVEKAIDFDAPLQSLNADTHILELFHGNTFAFKDFGARFMAQLMSYFVKDEKRPLHILVATSGDTGSAVAHGFLGIPNIFVTVLYPKGKVSEIQEKQFTTLGENITALEIEGTFDDCQALVKQAFLDKELTSKLFLTSANSINISRLVPQAFYYVRAYQQLIDKSKKTVFVVPSGNFGNLTAGILAQKIGLPVDRFVAATNANAVVPEYLETGNYKPRTSVPTISNAMDVGNPSNFARMNDLMPNLADMKENIVGYAFTDSETRQAMIEVKQKFGYVIDPHGAVGYLAWKHYQKTLTEPANGIILETAHPSKFVETVEETLGEKITIPAKLQDLLKRTKKSIGLGKDFEGFKKFLLEKV